MTSFIEKVNNNPWVVLGLNILSVIGFIISIAVENIVVKLVACGIFGLVIIIVVILYCCRKFSAEKIRAEMYNTFNINRKNTSTTINDLVVHLTTLGLQIKSTPQMSAQQYKNNCKSICQKIRTTLTTIYGQNINVCIKMIVTDSVMDQEYTDWKTQTLARDCDKYSERTKLDNVHQAVCDNTSFLELLDPKRGDVAFSSANIKDTVRKYKEASIEYRNPNKEYAKFYTSTIVCPIACETEDVSPTIVACAEQMGNIDTKYHVVGFLCIDSEHDFSDEMTPFVALMYDCRSISTALYAMFENRIINEIEQA